MSFKKNKKDTKVVINEYSESSYSKTDDEAHRNIHYWLASPIKQFSTIFMLQTKIYMKSKIPIFLLILVLAIPIIVYSGAIDSFLKAFLSGNSANSRAYAGTLLFFLTLMITWIVTMVLSKTIPDEFKERTAYLNLALPQSRTTFFLAKYLSGLMIISATFLLVYAFVILIATDKCGDLSMTATLKSMAYAFSSIFAFSGMVYGLSIFVKKAPTIIYLVVWFGVLPTLMGAGSMEIKGFSDIAAFFPFFGGDLATYALYPSTSISLSVGSMMLPFMEIPSVLTFVCIALAWGIVFLAMGWFYFRKKEM